MVRMSWHHYAKANAIEQSDWKPTFSKPDQFKSRTQVIKERRTYKVAGASPNPHNHTKSVRFMQRSFVDAENTGYVYEPVTPKVNDGKRTIFITFNGKKVIVQK